MSSISQQSDDYEESEVNVSDEEEIIQDQIPDQEQSEESQQSEEEVVVSPESSKISESDMNEIHEIIRKKVQVEQVKQQKKLDDLEANLEQEEKLKHNWRNKARSKLEILNQIKLGTDQTISILPQSLTEDEQIMLSMSKAQRYNTALLQQRKAFKQWFKDVDHNRVASRSNLHENTFPSHHIPIYLQNQESFVIVPPQNLSIRRGTIDQFIKLNIDNEPLLYQQLVDRRMGNNKIQKRKPYQKRKLPDQPQ